MARNVRLGGGFFTFTGKNEQFRKTAQQNIDAWKRQNAAQRRFARSARFANRQAKALANRLVGVAAAYVGINAAIGQGRALIEAGVAMQRLNSRLRLATGSSAGAAAEFEFLRNEARRLGVDLVGAANAFSGLAASTRGTSLAGENTRQIFLAVAEAGRVAGLSAEQMQGALVAVEQIASKGTVSMEELRGQLGERIPGAFQIAARAMNLTTEELNALVSSGQLTATEFLPRFAEQMRREFSGEIDNASQTAAASFARLGNALFELRTAFAESGVIEWLADVSEAFAELAGRSLEPDFSNIQAADFSVLDDYARKLNRDLETERRTLAQLQLEAPGMMIGGRTVEEQAAAVEKLENQLDSVYRIIRRGNRSAAQPVRVEAEAIVNLRSFDLPEEGVAAKLREEFAGSREQIDLINRSLGKTKDEQLAINAAARVDFAFRERRRELDTAQALGREREAAAYQNLVAARQLAEADSSKAAQENLKRAEQVLDAERENNRLLDVRRRRLEGEVSQRDRLIEKSVELATTQEAAVQALQRQESQLQNIYGGLEDVLTTAVVNWDDLGSTADNVLKSIYEGLVRELIIRRAIAAVANSSFGGAVSSFFGGISGAADGGRVSGLTVVGELGPELVDFSRPARVYTNDELSNALGSGGGNITFAPNIYSEDGPAIRRALGEAFVEFRGLMRADIINESRRTSPVRSVVGRT